MEKSCYTDAYRWYSMEFEFNSRVFYREIFQCVQNQIRQITINYSSQTKTYFTNIKRIQRKTDTDY